MSNSQKYVFWSWSFTCTVVLNKFSTSFHIPQHKSSQTDRPKIVAQVERKIPARSRGPIFSTLAPFQASWSAWEPVDGVETQGRRTVGDFLGLTSETEKKCRPDWSCTGWVASSKKNFRDDDWDDPKWTAMFFWDLFLKFSNDRASLRLLWIGPYRKVKRGFTLIRSSQDVLRWSEMYVFATVNNIHTICFINAYLSQKWERTWFPAPGLAVGRAFFFSEFVMWLFCDDKVWENWQGPFWGFSKKTWSNG